MANQDLSSLEQVYIPNRKPLICTVVNWGIVWHDPYGYVLVGENKDLYGHYVRTSSIKVLMLETGLVETLNSIYRVQGPANNKAAQAAYNARLGL